MDWKPSVVNVTGSSENRKLTRKKGVASTMLPFKTCPKSCPLLGNGCYAYYMEKPSPAPLTPLMLSQMEAAKIMRLPGNKPLRLHVKGDFFNRRCAEEIVGACEKYIEKQGEVVWAYTHNHKIPRSVFGNVSILRSCHTLKEVEKAHQDGFAAALTVKQFQSPKAYRISAKFVGIPCPAQTGDVKCEECKLCMRDTKLHGAKRVILFEGHGSGKGKVDKVSEL